MKPRIKILLLASVPVLLGGIWGLWMLGRGPMLQAGLDRALGRLRQQGLATDVQGLEWQGLGEAHLAQVAGLVGRDTVLRMRDMQVHLRPSWSLSGRDWVASVDFGSLEIDFRGWRVLGKGNFVPATWAMDMVGEFGKGSFGECGAGNAGAVDRLNSLASVEETAPSERLIGCMMTGCLPSRLPSDGSYGAGGVGEANGVGEACGLGEGRGVCPMREAIEIGAGIAVHGHYRLHMGPQSRSRGRRHFGAGIHLEQLALQHPALGDEIKTIRELDAWARVEATANAYALRPGSFLRVGDACMLGTARWDVVERKFALAFAVPTQPAGGLLALAQELAPTALGGLRIGGQAHGYLRMAGDLDSLATLQLAGDLQGEDIALLDGGLLRLDTLRGHALQPGMVALDDLPQYLQQAVVLSEDANFWTHHGFDREVIRLAIVENWEAGRFVRGAGTIPMQLMRNMYLHHGKQADRKLAEIALTWITEETHLMDKKTQLALYFNLIEWGPGVYGIRAAAQYYFHKTPVQLSVDEAIFLAAIIPNPLHAADLLETDGRLTPYAQEYYDSMRWMLYEGDLIGEEWLEAKYPRFSVRV